MATLEQLLEQGWADHDRDAAGVAVRLEQGLPLVADAAGAARFARLTAHVIGASLCDWPRAARVVAEVLARAVVTGAGAGTNGDRARVYTELALCRLMAGDSSGALATELLAMAAEPQAAAALSTLLRTRLLAAEALVACGRHAEGLAIHGAALALAEASDGAAQAARAVAVASNNIASALLELVPRDPALDLPMSTVAEAARRWWLRAGDWRNDQRSRYLLALVANSRGHHQEAIAQVDAALATIVANGGEPVDEAFLEVARARSLRGLGRSNQQAEALARAEAMRPVVAVAGPDVLEWFERELGRSR